MGEFMVAADDPGAADVRALLEVHLAFGRRHSPPEDVHALDVDALRAEDVSFFSIREVSDGRLLGVGALKQLDGAHAELKSMHTAEAARGRGVARAMLEHLLGVARARGCTRVSLETGSMAAFAPARSLYASAGFEPCEPFGDYRPSPNSTFLTLSLDRARRSGPVLRKVDAVTVRVPDLDAGLEFYADRLGHPMRWRNDAVGQAAVGLPDSDTEVVLTTSHGYEPNWLVESADAAAAAIEAAGGRVLSPPADIPVGRVAVVADPFGNVLVLVDLSKGRYAVGDDGRVTAVE